MNLVYIINKLNFEQILYDLSEIGSILPYNDKTKSLPQLEPRAFKVFEHVRTTNSSLSIIPPFRHFSLLQTCNCSRTVAEKLTTGQRVLLGAVVKVLVALRVGLVEMTLIEHRCVSTTL